MTETKWTPQSERWDITFSDPADGVDCFWLCKGAMIITGIEGPQSDERQAKRAHLIAAAPELYEALATILRCYDLRPDVMRFLSDEMEGNARAALARARGETP